MGIFLKLYISLQKIIFVIDSLHNSHFIHINLCPQKKFPKQTKSSLPRWYQRSGWKSVCRVCATSKKTQFCKEVSFCVCETDINLGCSMMN